MSKSLCDQLPQITSFFDKVDGTLWRISITKRNVTNVLRQYKHQNIPSKYMLYGDK
jgi:hypothetical protein